MTTKQIKSLVNAALAAGWREADTKSGRTMLFSPDGESQVVLPLNPKEYRGLRNVRSELRKRGVDC